MKLVDTNVMLHAVNADAAGSARCRAAVEALANGPELWALTWGVVYEFLRVATHPRVFPTPLTLAAASAFVFGLTARPNCLVLTETPAHADVLRHCLTDSPRVAGNLVHDFHAAVLMREHGVATIITFDRDFHAFPWVTLKVP